MLLCGSPWGIGSYTCTEYGLVYGYSPRNINPHDFIPDYECCTEKEIEAWTKAKEEWNKL